MNYSNQYNTKIYGYIYTENQVPYEDLNLLMSCNISQRDIYIDTNDRTSLKALRDVILSCGDTLVMRSTDALGSNKKFIKELLRCLYIKGIVVFFLENQELNYNMPIENKLDLLESILIRNENERKRQATIEGMAKMPVNENGIRVSAKTFKEIGRPIVKVPLNFKQIYIRWKNGEISTIDAVKQSGLKRSTFYNRVKEYEEFNNII